MRVRNDSGAGRVIGRRGLSFLAAVLYLLPPAASGLHLVLHEHAPDGSGRLVHVRSGPSSKPRHQDPALAHVADDDATPCSVLPEHLRSASALRAAEPTQSRRAPAAQRSAPFPVTDRCYGLPVLSLSPNHSPPSHA